MSRQGNREADKNGIPDKDPNEPVILRIRMRRRLLDRIKRIVEWERSQDRDWDMSAACREQLTEWVVRREAEIKFIQQRDFSGDAPITMGVVFFGELPQDQQFVDERAAKN